MYDLKKIYASNKEELNKLLERVHETEEWIEKSVEEIVSTVKREGFAGVAAYTEKFDKARLTEDTFLVSEKEYEEAYQKVDEEFLAALREAIDNIADFHLRQRKESWWKTEENGNITGQIVRPLERVGCYVPGGTAAYPSSVLMTALPAKVAGVEKIIVVSPPAADGSMNPYTLVAAKEVGVTEFYKVGGAQGVAALAYGAGSLQPVDKIVGPGNIFVTVAKKMVYGDVDIDMLAGPSEILVVADDSADPVYVAADLLSQAEHDKMASAILVTDSEDLAMAVQEELEVQLNKLSRKEIAREAVLNNSGVIVASSLEEAIEIANKFAPEHLELSLDKPFDWIGKIKNAGAVFMGHYTPEPVGDYFAGPNHVLPTGGTARFYSPLNLDTYMKKISVIAYSEDGILACGKKIVKLAETEGLEAHANSVRVRLENR